MTHQPPPSRILVVDDAPETLELLNRNLTDTGYDVRTATGVAQAIDILDRDRVDLVITDLKMPKVSGLDLVRHVRENCSDTEVMMITGYPTIENAVTAVKAGSREYLTKPFTDEELLTAVQRVLHLQNARRRARTRHDHPPAVHGLIGQSAAMRAVFHAIDKAATSSATVLISGESGTGKELAARAIHYAGPRASAPFVPVNCGSIPENLLESELFGHLRGAFTGAVSPRTGFFRTAHGGTIFLDEIGNTGLPMQAKLLRVLEDGHVYMLGSDRPHKIDVRVVAASNKDLQTLVRSGVFREDLFFRLNVIAIAMPPLRDRADDVLLLAAHFMNEFADDSGRAAPQFTDDTLDVFRRYHWPGNVRELENLVQRLLVMTEHERIDVTDLPPNMRFSVEGGDDLDRSLADIEARHIRRVLASVDGNKSRAARILGIDRKTLREKLKATEDHPES